MSNLGDYLGQLMAEIAMARMQADLETVRIAELYAAHPLLRTMAVPRLRLPDVDLDLPVLIRASEAPRDGETTRGGVQPREMRNTFESVLRTHLAKAGTSLSRMENTRLRATLADRERTRLSPAETAVDINRNADELTSAAMAVLGTPDAPVVDPVALKNDVRLAFLQLRTPPPRLDVIVSSAEIREGASNDNVTRIRLKITEQGVEWTSIETNGEMQDRLVPE